MEYRIGLIPIVILTGLISCKPKSISTSLSVDAYQQISGTPNFMIRYTASGGIVSFAIFSKANPKQPLFETLPGQNAVQGSYGLSQMKEAHQQYTLERLSGNAANCTSTAAKVLDPSKFSVSGKLTGSSCNLDYTLSFSEVSPGNLAFKIVSSSTAKKDSEQQNLSISNRMELGLAFRSPANEAIWGFGAQMTHLDLKGRKVPIVVQEQGIGRGNKNATLDAFETIAPGAGGTEVSSYSPAPLFLSSQNRGFILENTQYSEFDLSDPAMIKTSTLSSEVTGHIIAGNSPADLLTEISAYTGRMRPLPDWIQNGIVLGIQGGEARIQQAVAKLKAAGAQISALWIQDWVGARKESMLGIPLGSFLWWNWESDDQLYPNWPQFVSGMRAQGIRVMTYINPFLVDPSSKPKLKHSYFNEAINNGYFVKKSDGSPYLSTIITFPAGILDLSRNATRAWIKSIIRENIVKAGVSGYMADYAEALPFDSHVDAMGGAFEFHNLFPEAWADLHREVAAESGLGDDFVYFMRSGFTRSPGKNRLFWLGDQTTTWDKYDGLQSSIVGMLNSGLSGQSLNHSDIGGYTALVIPGVDPIVRSKELFMRWCEVNAFTTLYRTHEGNRPELNHQFDSDDETFRHFVKFGKIYSALAPYRKLLMSEASRKGWPLVRPMFFNDASASHTWKMDNQFFLGNDYVVAPVLNPGKSTVRVWLPKGSWKHLFSKEIFSEGFVDVPAPIGQPAVFVREGSSEAGRIFALLGNLAQ